MQGGPLKVLVTGAAGFIGSHLCEALLKSGHDVIGIDNLSDFYSPRIKQKNLDEVGATAKQAGKKFIFHKADLRDDNALKRIFESHVFDVVVHLAAMAGVRPSMERPAEYADVNVLGTTKLLQIMQVSGIKNMVFASSSSVYGNSEKLPFSEKDFVDNPISPYAATKKAAELMCHVYHSAHGMSIACLRFFTVYGPRQRPDLAIHKFTELLFAGKALPIYGDGSKSRDFTYIDDTIDGVLKAIHWTLNQSTAQYEIFNLGESQTISVNDMIAALERATSLQAKRDHHPDMPGDVQKTFADISKAKKILGYKPNTSLEQGIKNFVAWYKALHKIK